LHQDSFKKRKTTIRKSMKLTTEKESRPHNSIYKKMAVQLLNEALCFGSNSLVADSFHHRNRQLLVAAKLWQKPFLADL
jgi:hypothetical protein